MPRIKPSIQNKQHISLDDMCFLIVQEMKDDHLGQHIPIEKKRQVFCAQTSIYSQEFFSAGQSGIKSTLMLVVDSEEYDGQQILEYEDKRYSIYRNFPRSDGQTELYCEVRVGD